MRIQLESLDIENLKGIRKRHIDFALQDITVIIAENGRCKTTVYIGFLWLLFGKDDSGLTNFAIAPLDANNQPIKGLTTMVEGRLRFDGATHTFRKERAEKVTTHRNTSDGKNSYSVSYPISYWIDDVPKKEGEYKKFIADLIQEDTFKILTDLQYFNDNKNFPWEKRRALLLDFVKGIDQPKGFEKLLGVLSGRSVKDYKKVLAGEKDGYIEERDEINPRINEVNRALESYVVEDNIKLEQTRSKIENRIAELKSKRTNLLSEETERQEIQDKINGLERKKIERAGVLKNDTSAIQSLLDERAKINNTLADKDEEIQNINNDIDIQETKLAGQKRTLNTLTESLAVLREYYEEISQKPLDDICFNCERKLPQNKIEEAEENRKVELEKLTDDSNDLRKQINVCDDEITKTENTLQGMRNVLAEAESKFEEYNDKALKRLDKIAQAVKDNITPPPEQDKIWQGYCEEIKRLQDQLGEPVAEQLSKIETSLTTADAELTKVNNSLAQADRNKADRQRVEELSDREKELSELINDVDRRLAEIDSYDIALSNMIEAAVNDKFRFVKFKLFNRLLNGGIELCCEATYNGIPWSGGISTGERILIGIDIVNVLSAHYGISVPLFIDHAESITFDVESEAQLVELYAQRGVRELTIKTKPKSITAKSEGEQNDSQPKTTRKPKARAKKAN